MKIERKAGPDVEYIREARPYFLASGRFHGKLVLAEGRSQREARTNWVLAAVRGYAGTA